MFKIFGGIPIKSIIVFSPHPDDAVLACGGTIIKSIQENLSVYIIYLTDGRACYQVNKIEIGLSPADIAAGRKKEAIESSQKLRVPPNNLFFLAICDLELKNPKNFDNALNEIKKWLKKIKPFRVFGPIFKDPHPDHEATHNIILKIVKDYPNIEFYMYGLQKAIGKSDLRIDISDVREQKAEAMFIHKIELVYEKEIYEILALQTKEKFRLYQ